MLFDSHAHLNDERFDEDREELISSLNEKGVDLVVNPGACMKTSAESVELANKYDFIYAAVGVHPHDVKDLTEADMEELKKMATENEIGCVLHCYSGNVELAREYVKMGCYISISGTVTFKNNKKTKEVVREIPLDRLLIETDSPYMAPTPHRGKRNDPSLVQFVADTIAVEKGISYEKVCEATKENAKKFFGIK